MTSSGKTSFTRRLLRHKDDLFIPKPDKVLYCYGQFQKVFEDMENELPFIEFVHGLPSEEKIKEFANPNQHRIIVTDDMMQSVVQNKDMEHLFTRGSHHLNLTIIYLNQNMFCQGKCARNINLNTSVLVLMRNPRDTNQIKVLSRQIGAGNVLVDAYRDTHQTPFSYLVVDLSPFTEEKHRIRTNIFPGEDTIIYTQ